MDDLLEAAGSPVYDISLNTTDIGEALSAFDSFCSDTPTYGGNECSYCNIIMNITENGTHIVCPDCGLMRDYDEPSAAITSNSNLRVQGNGAYDYGKNLYKSADLNSELTRHDKIFHEILAYCKKYEDEYKCGVPKNVIEHTTDIFCRISAMGVRRSDNKRKIIAACYYFACLAQKIQMPTKTIAIMFNLRSIGISDGMRSVTNYVAKGVIPEDEITLDPLEAAVHTIFRQLEINNDLKSEVKRIIETADRKNIGISSSLDSKIVGATFIVLSRNNIKMDLKKISALRGIRQATIQKYIDFVNARISNFY